MIKQKKLSIFPGYYQFIFFREFSPEILEEPAQPMHAVINERQMSRFEIMVGL